MKKNLNVMTKIVRKLTDNEFETLFNSIKKDYNQEDLNKIRDSFATKHLVMSTSTEINSKVSSISFLYKDELHKIQRIFYRKDIRERIGGLLILLYGETGTGKTSFVKELEKNNKNVDFEYINLEQIISSKMGQTQINLLSLIDKINIEKKEKVIFIDELDSIISNRISNENSERKKITSTFIKLIDSLNKNIILIAATNYLDLIDESIIRRFNFKIEGKKMSINEFIYLFDKETNSFLSRKKSVLSIIDRKFTIADLNSFINHIEIEKEFKKEVLPFPEFLNFFNIKNIDLNNLSIKNKIYLKKLNNA